MNERDTKAPFDRMVDLLLDAAALIDDLDGDDRVVFEAPIRFLLLAAGRRIAQDLEDETVDG